MRFANSKKTEKKEAKRIKFVCFVVQFYNSKFGLWVYLFYLSKYYEFIDTWIVMARGRRPIFLQLFYFQLKKLDTRNPYNCLEIFKSNNFLGLLVLVNLILGKILI